MKKINLFSLNNIECQNLEFIFNVETLNNTSSNLSLMYLLNCKIYNMGLS